MATQPSSSPSLLKKKSRVVTEEMEKWRWEEEVVEGPRKTPKRIRWKAGGGGCELGSKETSGIHPRVALLRISALSEERPPGPAGEDKITSRGRRYRDRSGA